MTSTENEINASLSCCNFYQLLISLFTFVVLNLPFRIFHRVTKVFKEGGLLLFEIYQVQPVPVPDGIKEALTFFSVLVKVQQIVHQRKVVSSFLKNSE